jgi:uncharacterized protein (TIGR02145 family)
VVIKDKNGSSAEILIGSNVTVVATPNENCEFKGWFVGNSDTPISTDAIYTFTVNEDISLVAKFAKPINNVCVIANGNGSVTIRNNGSESAELAAGTSVAVMAIPDVDYEFKGWFVANSETPVSTDEIYTFTLTEDVVLIAKFAEPFGEEETVEIDLNPSGSIGGYDYVDLGLSVKWATYNVGATKPEEYGDYYAWGEIKPKQHYVGDNYTYKSNPETLPLSADAANVNWGGSWRMPTRAEYDELRNHCTWEWTTLNGEKGYKVISKKNGNSIFLPAAGRRYNNLYSAGSLGHYWSSSLGTDYRYAYYLLFNSSYVSFNYYTGHRCHGLSVRAVCE